MKKYISFSVLLCLCIGIVALLFWQFRDPAPDEELGGTSDTDHIAAVATGDTTSTEDTTAVTDTTATEVPTVPALPDPITLDLSGTILNRYVTPLTLRVEWAAFRDAKNADIYVSTEIYLDCDELALPAAQSGYITVNGVTVSFSSPEIAITGGGSVRIGTAAFKVTGEEHGDIDIPVYACFDVNALHGGVQYHRTELTGFIRITDNYGDMESAVSLEVTPRSETSLPSGSAVLSLASVLEYMGLPSNAEFISDNHLTKMPAGFTSPEDANVGNPRNEFNSYECYAPVLANAAGSYLDTLPYACEVEDMTGCNMEALFLSLSSDAPAIVWLPADTDKGPELAHTWLIEGETVYMPAIRCAVLSGYDLDAETVTLIYPNEEPKTMDIDLFEELFLRMGSQCVVIK